MTRKIDALLAEYGESHQNATNKAIHWVCVPVIVWTLMAFLWSLPPVAGVNWLYLLLVPALIYYVVLSPPLAVGFVVFALVAVLLIRLVDASATLPLSLVAVILFLLAWMGQFWGHKVEGRKPSFFKDVQFLLIGPAWLMSFIYRRLGLPI